jgi:hypothetical protein
MPELAQKAPESMRFLLCPAQNAWLVCARNRQNSPFFADNLLCVATGYPICGIPDTRNARGKAMTVYKSFEATYPRYAFAPLVRLGIAIAAWITGRSQTGKATAGHGADGVIGGAHGAAA